VADTATKEKAEGGGPRQPIPKDVEERLKRGRAGLAEVQARRLLGIEFANGNHFSELNRDGTKVTNLSTVPVALGGEKPDHRVRRSHDIVSPMLQRKTSAATQRDPDWESTGATSDPEDYAGSRLALKIARAGYPVWGFPTGEQRALWWAMVTEEAFGRAAWNANVGPYEDVSQHPEAEVEDPPGSGEFPYAGQPHPEKPQWRGRGEIAVTIYSGLEVLWEPGVDFENSRWYAVEHARSVEELEDEEGYIKVPGETLAADARTASEGRAVSKEKKGSKLAMVTEYFERPCRKYPKGRWSTYASGRKILPDDDYPMQDNEGRVVDTPCLRRLIYDVDASSDRAKGLVQKIIDTVRSYDQAINKQSEYSQIGLVAQLMAAEGVLLTDPTDEPGLVLEYDRSLARGEKPEWRENITFPSELFEMEERAKARFSDMAFDEDIPPQLESGKAIGQARELSSSAWQRFIDDFNRFRSELMSDCLVIAQRKYGPDRVMKYQGTTGWESVKDFEGADIRGQTDVKVKSTATETQSREQVEQRIMQLAQTFPGVFPPEVVIEALNSANPEKLIQGYEEDVGRAHRVVQMIREGRFWDEPDRPALPGEEALKVDLRGNPMVPGWLPRPFDSLPITKAAIEEWMKTDDWDRSSQEVKEASLFYYQKILDLESQQALRQEEQQNALAEEQGMANASKEQGPKTPPSQPGAETAPPPKQ
jgi:hypothetical protein